jgi:hypothetical protein
MQGYEKFGINRANGVTTYREWAPAAQGTHPVKASAPSLDCAQSQTADTQAACVITASLPSLVRELCMVQLMHAAHHMFAYTSAQL